LRSRKITKRIHEMIHSCKKHTILTEFFQKSSVNMSVDSHFSSLTDPFLSFHISFVDMMDCFFGPFLGICWRTLVFLSIFLSVIEFHIRQSIRLASVDGLSNADWCFGLFLVVRRRTEWRRCYIFPSSGCYLQSIDGSQNGQMPLQSGLPVVQSIDWQQKWTKIAISGRKFVGGQQKMDQISNISQKVSRRITKKGPK